MRSLAPLDLAPLDPPDQHRAAGLAGAMAARGQAEGPPLLAAIRRAAFAAAPGLDRRGLAMRLAHSYADSFRATRLAHDAAERRVGAALRPLLAARAPAAALRAAAAAADRDGALDPAAREALVAAAIGAELARGRRA